MNFNIKNDIIESAQSTIDDFILNRKVELKEFIIVYHNRCELTIDDVSCIRIQRVQPILSLLPVYNLEWIGPGDELYKTDIQFEDVCEEIISIIRVYKQIIIDLDNYKEDEYLTKLF